MLGVETIKPNVVPIMSDKDFGIFLDASMAFDWTFKMASQPVSYNPLLPIL